MTVARHGTALRMSPFLIAFCFVCLPAVAQYSGGSGRADDPYQIATAADLIALGETLDDYDKHFILTADIDLDPNLPRGKVFDEAVVGGDWNTRFTGVFDGNNHVISNFALSSTARSVYVGLFGHLGGAHGEIKNLGLVNAAIDAAEGWAVGALVGSNLGAVVHCYSAGSVTGESRQCVGALVGYNWSALIGCYSTCRVSGHGSVGGLVGCNEGTVAYCYSTGAVSSETSSVGGLVGYNEGALTHCYSTGPTRWKGTSAGGLVGRMGWWHRETACFWDAETSGPSQGGPSTGTGLATAEMQDVQTYLDAGWDWIGETENGTSEIWQMPTGGGYPVLGFFNGYTPPRLRGDGTPEYPYLVSDAMELGAMVYCSPYAFCRLAGPIDLSGISWGAAPIPWFAGVFDGDGLTISHLTIRGGGGLGLVGELAYGGEIRDVGVRDVNVTGTGSCVSGLSGRSWGTVTRCYSSGVVHGEGMSVGGLIGFNDSGVVTHCYSTCAATGGWEVGGLVGSSRGSVTHCYSVDLPEAKPFGGSVIGSDLGVMIGCFSLRTDSGPPARRDLCAAVQPVSRMQDVQTYLDAGWDWVGESKNGTSEIWQMAEGGDRPVLTTFSGYAPPVLAGRGTPDDPHLVSDALELGAVVHYRPGAHYRLGAAIDLSGIRWATAVVPSFTGTFDGNGLIISHLTIQGGGNLGLFGRLACGATVRDLGVVDANVVGSHDRIGGLVGLNYDGSVTGSYSTGVVTGVRSVGGLTGYNWWGYVIDCNCAAAVSGTQSIGGLLGHNTGIVVNCHSYGEIAGGKSVGGLLGYNVGSLDRCYNAAVVDANENVGGLIGFSLCGRVSRCYNAGAVSGHVDVGGLLGRIGDMWYDASYPNTVIHCYSAGPVTGYDHVGGLIGVNHGDVIHCYSAGTVAGYDRVGGSIGVNHGDVIHCYSSGPIRGDLSVGGLIGFHGAAIVSCLWDRQASGRMEMCGASGDFATGCDNAFGKTTAQMKAASTFLEAGWDFIGETENGTDDIWWILEGLDYPRLWWELEGEEPER